MRWRRRPPPCRRCGRPGCAGDLRRSRSRYWRPPVPWSGRRVPAPTRRPCPARNRPQAGTAGRRPAPGEAMAGIAAGAREHRTTGTTAALQDCARSSRFPPQTPHARGAVCTRARSNDWRPMTGITRDVCGIGHAMRDKNAEYGSDSLASRRRRHPSGAMRRRAGHVCMHGFAWRHLGNAASCRHDGCHWLQRGHSKLHSQCRLHAIRASPNWGNDTVHPSGRNRSAHRGPGPAPPLTQMRAVR